jgi:hypothetical protein
MSILEGAAGIYSDDFSGATFPEAQWSKVNDDGGNGVTITQSGFGTSDAWAVFTIASGERRDILDGGNALRLEQPCTPATAFEMTAKVETLVSVNDQEVGIYIRNTAATYGVNMGIYQLDGDKWAWSADVFGQASGPGMDNLVNSWTGPVWFRIAYDGGTEVVCSASDTGAFGGEEETATWEPDNLAANFVGIYAATFDTDPAWETEFDFFFESSAIISPEDPTGRRVMVIS